MALSSQVAIDCTDQSETSYIPINASAFNVLSTRKEKRDIQKLSQADQARWLAEVAKMEPSHYLRTGEKLVQGRPASAPGEREHLRLGLIAEELPPELVSDGRSVDVYALTTALVAAVKQLNSEVKQQGETIRCLKEEIELLRSSR